MRTAFLGTSDFAAAVLRRLAASAHAPGLVITRPDRPRGRGRRMASPPVAVAARELGIALEQPDSINGSAALQRIDEYRPQTLCVCAFGALITEPLLSRYPMLNVHPSLLPRWRGAAPIERAIMAGDQSTGVSLMELTAGLDSGPVCAQAREPVREDDTYGSLADRLARIGGELLVTVLDEHPACWEQDEAGATYAEKITAADRELVPLRPADELERVVRALTPHVGAYAILPGGSRLGVLQARVVPGEGEPGVVLDGAIPLLRTLSGSLELLTVQPPGGRPMSGPDYLRGHRR